MRQLIFLIFGISFLCLPAFEKAQGDDDSAAALWRYYPPLRPAISPGQGNRSGHSIILQHAVNSDDEGPVQIQGEIREFNSPTDPLFGQEARPSWQLPKEDKPLYNRPSYDRPDYSPPAYRLEAVKLPMADRPIYQAPNYDKPSNEILPYNGPALIAPSEVAPDYRGPNYDVTPNYAPTTNRPAYDRSHIEYTQPGYNPPVEDRPEYAPPRVTKPDYPFPPEG